ncbi:Septin-domain-containing protein [Fusarium tricinctum]|uniref:Septin-domain-containing protein n=1 Tax=Fusarium tricinctum TaxID=61284 RepID=A0A8K0W929_9HYPO|nr:Septin-domain-containing protein [Fusarium tricinctum]
MALDLMQHVRARTRSVHFDRGLLFMASSPLAESSPKTSRDSKRTISLPLGPDDEMSSPPSSPRPSTVRHYRSMLDVDTQDPPTLSPMKPMSFDELYIDAVPNEMIADTSAQYGKFDSKDITRRELSRSDRRDTSSHYSTSQAPPRASTLHSITFQPSFPSPGSESPALVPSASPVNVPSQPPPTTDNRNIVRRKLTGYVGFANLPNQWHRKSVRKGFNFNVMVVGESGLGKSTLVNTLFNTSLYPPKERKGPSLDIIPKTVTIQSISADIEEAGVRLRLTVVDTPGFGDFVNNDESWRPIVDNIEQRFDSYLDAENKVNRMNIVDNRIHACVFFIQPTGHSLKPLDIEVMRRLHTKVNLIPVIAKADTLTDEEIAAFKSRILADIKHHGIQIFEGPRYELDDEETIAENNEIMSKVPFAVVGANNEITSADGRKIRGRAYPWGIIEVDNEEHCDFVKLRQMLIRTHMEELKEHTNNQLYENYRTDKLLAMGVSQDPSVFKEVNPAVKQEEERALHEQKLAKMEAEMKMVFQQKVAEKESKLKQSEEELYARHKEMKEQLDRQRLELEDKKQRVESGRPLEKEGKRKGFSLR